MSDEIVLTGIEGFDEVCSGGLIRDSTYLLAGASGSGKTIFGLQYLYNGATKYGENGIFLATEERPARIRRNALRFGWDFEALENENKIAFIDAASTKIGMPSVEKYADARKFEKFEMNNVIDKLISVQEDINAARAVVDSSTSLGYLISDPARMRVEILQLGATLETLGMTSLMISEVLEDKTRGFGIEMFVTDGVIVVYYKRSENMRLRGIEIYKMRGSDHSHKIHPLDITSKGIVVHSHEELYGEF
jgi:KaiC/GvpD/RAD55 family RecA-like ATPase